MTNEIKPVIRKQLFRMISKHEPLTWGKRTIAVAKGATLAPLVAVVLCASAASAAPFAPASVYDCKGQGVTVSYANDSGGGVPSVLIKLGPKVIKARGNDVQIQRTVLGSLVTVQNGSVPDSHTDTLTLLAPDVNVSVIPIKLPVQFMTSFFSTRTFTSIGGPAFVQGVIQQSSSQPLFCKASMATQ
jgi:hypothetical protein